MEKTWSFQLDGYDCVVQARWRATSGWGSVSVDGEQVHSWGLHIGAFRRTRFWIGDHQAELRRAAGRATAFSDHVEDLDLYIDGRLAEDLPVPRALAGNQVVSTTPSTCPNCRNAATMLVYSTGVCEIICASCGRFPVG